MLHSGIPIQKAFDLAIGKTGDMHCRHAMQGVSDSLGAGEDVSSAMRAQGDAFPELVIDMVGVAEQTGALPEILVSLANHYDNILRLRRQFYSSIAWPVLQLVMSILVVAGAIFILGWIAQSTAGKSVDVLGLGLQGTQGAVLWLTCTFGTFFVLFIVYQILTRALGGKKFLHSLVMRIPVVGTCMRSFAIARFSWAFALTQQAGMPIEQSIRASMKATSNGAFLGAGDHIWTLVHNGEPLVDALDSARLFPPDFIEMVRVAETAGTVPETLQHLTPQFEDQARRSLTALTAAVSWTVWMMVAGFIIFIIFRIFSTYISMIYEYMPE